MISCRYLFFISIGSFLLISCAHHRDVRPGADGHHRVVVTGEDTESGAQDAIKQANHFCKENGGGYAGFTKEDKKYTGSMDEGSYKTAKTASKVAQAVGGAGYVFGGRNERTAGGIVGLGGGIADSALGKGYTVDMQFKCVR